MVSLAVYTQSLLLVFVALFPVSFCDAAETKCYNFDGTPADASFKPCNGTAGVSMCCQLGEASNGGDTCGSGSSYGLCVTGLGSQLWRRSCTDSSWRDPRCLPLCIAGNGTHADSTITECSDGSYCCGQNATSCCEANQGMFIVNDVLAATLPTLTASAVFGTTTLSAPSSSSSTFSPSPTSSPPASIAITIPLSLLSTATSLPTPTLPPNPTPPPTNTLSTGAKAGLAIGITALTLVLLILAFFFYRKRQSNHYSHSQSLRDNTKTPIWGGAFPPNFGDGSYLGDRSPTTSTHSLNSCAPSSRNGSFSVFEGETEGPAPVTPVEIVGFHGGGSFGGRGREQVFEVEDTHRGRFEIGRPPGYFDETRRVLEMEGSTPVTPSSEVGDHKGGWLEPRLPRGRVEMP